MAGLFQKSRGGSSHRYFDGVKPFLRLLHFEGDYVVFGDVAITRFDMDEDVLPSIIGGDKAVAFVVVEKLDRSLGHVF